MSAGRLRWLVPILWALLPAAALAGEGASPAFPRGEMPDQVHQALLEALKSLPKDDLRRDYSHVRKATEHRRS